MRRLAGLALLCGLALCSAGCIMVFGVGRSVTNLSDNKKMVEIDDELYLLDLETNRFEKVDKKSLVHSETVITTDND